MDKKNYFILIVDDSILIRRLIRITLNQIDHLKINFSEASDGKKAFELLNHQKPDLIITDYNMPEMNGLELIFELQADDVFNSIPIILMTSDDDYDFSNNPDFLYIKKPFVKEHLIETVSGILKP